jgi:hypothetical protein
MSKRPNPEFPWEIRADRIGMSRVGAVFSGISAEKQPFRQVYFQSLKASKE